VQFYTFISVRNVCGIRFFQNPLLNAFNLHSGKKGNKINTVSSPGLGKKG
jgi:hypothetical protein